MQNSNIVISVICVILLLVVVFYFIAVSCSAGAYVGTSDVLKKCACSNCSDKKCADCPLCMKNNKESYDGGYLDLVQYSSPNYSMPTYPVMFGEQSPPGAIEPSNVTNKYVHLDKEQDMLLRVLKEPDNIDYIHGFIGSKYSNDKSLYDGVW